MSKTLILTIGLPLSGKTTWAVKQKHPIVNPDSIRYALHGKRYEKKAEPYVWATAYCMTEALFLAGHNIVIIDATNNTQKRRDEWKKKFEDIATIDYMIINTSAEECIRRAKLAKDDVIVPVIERMEKERDWGVGRTYLTNTKLV